MKVAIFRRGHFNAAHRLHNPKWSDEKNIEVFGICNNPNYHGHNYEFEVKLIGEVDPETGFVINLKDLKNMIKEKVEKRFDHKNLNLDVPEFKDLPPSTEYVCYTIWKILKEHLGAELDVTVKLWETPRNAAQYPPNG